MFVERCVAIVWQNGQSPPFIIKDVQHDCAGQSRNAVGGHPQPLSVPRFPWNY